MVVLTFLIIALVLYMLALIIIGKTSFSALPWYINFSIIISLALIVGLAVKWIMPWRQSAEAEEEVYKDLIRLPKEYFFLSDFHKDKKRNVDFIVIGPTGIFAIEAKNTPKGLITLDKDHLCINGSCFKTIDPFKQTYDEGEQIREYLKESLALSLPVTPVLVFTNPGVELAFGKEKQNGVFIIGINYLYNLIREQKREENLTPELCKKIKDDMNKYCSDIV